VYVTSQAVGVDQICTAASVGVYYGVSGSAIAQYLQHDGRNINSTTTTEIKRLYSLFLYYRHTPSSRWRCAIRYRRQRAGLTVDAVEPDARRR